VLLNDGACDFCAALRTGLKPDSPSLNQAAAPSIKRGQKPGIPSKKKQPVSKKSNGSGSSRHLKRSNSQLSANLNGNGGGTTTRGGGRSTRNNNNNGNSGKENKTRHSSSGTSKDKGALENEDSNAADTEDEPTIGQIKRDDEDHHAVTIIASLDDSFILKHDMCLSCGSFGKHDGEAVTADDTECPALIACSQCGQSFHHYCAGITNVNNVMCERGWRCLDCTVCEGCGTATDESRLLLCDDCDISYHIYCLVPPLPRVPPGNWKCKWCVKCVKCGSRSPNGSNSSSKQRMEWKNNYTECSPCNSTTICHQCSVAYTESELIGKCGLCECWSHLACGKQEHTDSSSAAAEFTCATCQAEKIEAALRLKKCGEQLAESQSAAIRFLDELATLARPPVQRDEGIYLTDSGADLLKRLKVKKLLMNDKREKTIFLEEVSFIMDVSVI
jgi:hypothetical protein